MQKYYLICLPSIISSPSQAVLVSTIVTEFFPRIIEQVQLANITALSFIFEYPVNKMEISLLAMVFLESITILQRQR